jgi:benzoyl-CoA reductase/2-hydroxyglutaryl-CoA dehydratase subunit BcrC/BadD/HgdB
MLEKLTSGLEKTTVSSRANNPVRLMIAGSLLAGGDNKIIDIARDIDANIVVDAFCTGSLLSRKNTTIYGIAGNPINALAERYLYNMPCNSMYDLDKRVSYIEGVARDYRLDGLIYYSLKYCDASRTEFSIVKDHLLKILNIPSLLIESEYSPSDIGNIRIKMEAFIEMLEAAR